MGHKDVSDNNTQSFVWGFYMIERIARPFPDHFDESSKVVLNSMIILDKFMNGS